MADLILFDEFINNLLTKKIDLSADTFKAVLSNTAPDPAADDELADITQISAGSGYTTGGVTLANVTFAETGAGTGVWQWSCDDFGWTASGGSLGPFRYVVIYDDTASGDKLIGYRDLGMAVTLGDTDSFTVDVGPNGLIRSQEV